MYRLFPSITWFLRVNCRWLMVFIILKFFSLTAFSQSDSIIKPPIYKMNIGLSIIPEFTNLIVTSPIGQAKVRSEVGFSTGINLEFHLARKASIRTGIAYGKKNYHHTLSGLIFGSDIDPHIGIITSSKIESKVSLSELQIPLVYLYEFKKHKFFFSGGMEFIFPFANNSECIIFYGNGDIEKLSNINKNSLKCALDCSIGYKLPVSDKLSISIEPMFKYYLKEYINLGTHLNNFRLNAALNFRL